MTFPIDAKPGIYYDIPDAEYRAHGALSNSGLEAELHPRGISDATRKAFTLGNIFDAWFTDRPTFNQMYLPLQWPPKLNPGNQEIEKAISELDKDVDGVPIWDGRKKVCRELLSNIEEYNQDKWCVSPRERKQLSAMAASVTANPDFDAPRKDPGRKTQVVVVWVDRVTSILCRGRADVYLPEADAIYDLKTTALGTPGDFAYNEVGNAEYSYRTAAAMYHDGLLYATQKPPTFTWLASSKCKDEEGNYPCWTRQATAEDILLGRGAYCEKLRVFKERFPGHESIKLGERFGN